jgi:glycosyltransferase involved in cell wall biosynthesis
MTDFEVFSADYWESRFEKDWALSRGCEQTRYFARILLDRLPAWLEDEIRANRLSILDWGCAEGEAVDSFRTHFPRSHIAGIDRSPSAIRNARLKFGPHDFVSQDVLSTPLPASFDVLVTSHVLQYFQAPWRVLSKLGVHVTRHLLVLVPFRGENLPGTLYTFDDATIGTRVDPDFILSSCQVILSGRPAVPNGQASHSQVLLVYSRLPYYPRSGTVFGESALTADSGIFAAAPSRSAPADLPSLGISAPAAGASPPPEPGTDINPGVNPSITPGVNPIDAIILPELRRAQSLAVVACAIPFSSALNQRPICCAKYLADRGATVLFVELWQCPEQAIHQTGEEVYPGVFTIPFYAFQSGIRFTFQDHMDAIAAAAPAKKSYLCTLPARELVEAARVLRAAGFHIHYDIMDDWEAFFEGDEEMTHWFSAPVELEMLALADTVTAVSGRLVEKFRRLRSDIVEARNGYQPSALDCEPFAAARAPLQRPKVVGYFGHFSDAWFDWETLFHAARERPEIEFELIGYGLSDHSLLRLKSFPNIRFVGLVPQKNLGRYAARWWAAMIPFQTSTLSAAVDPLKVYEYLYFGLPVLVTGIPAVADYPLVQLVADRDSFLSALDGLPDRPDEQSLSEVAEFLKTCVWEARLATLDSLLEHQGGEAEPAERQAALRSDVRYWQAKAAELEKQLERQRRHEARAEQARLEAAEQAMRDAAAMEALRSEVRDWQSQAAALTNQLDELMRSQERHREEQEAREAEVAARQAALSSQVEYWQDKSADLGRQLDEQRERLQKTVHQLGALEGNSAAEIRTLQARVAAGASEAANLRRLTADLLRSRSWKITAPLRFLSKPLFSAPAESPTPEPPANQSAAPSPAHPSPESAPAPDSLESLWAELEGARSIAIIPCAVPFRVTFAQRPISCARYLADGGSTVLYVNWPWCSGEAMPPDGQEVYPRIFHLSLAAFQSNINRIASAATSLPPANEATRPPVPSPRLPNEATRPLFLCSLPTPDLLEAVRPLRAGGYHIHYDIMDEWEEFHRAGEASWYAASVERELVMLSDTVTAVSVRLADKFARIRSDIAVVHNGYDPAALGCPQFVAARAPLDRPKVVGYFGHLSDAWFDWEAVWEAARKLPDVQFELIGYGLSDRSRARMGDFANIRFSGLVAQNDLHRHARKWWAGIIPFRSSALSAAVDPLKIYEYLHLGLPTVVTGVSGIADYPLVQFARDRAGFLAALGQIQNRPDEQCLREVADFLKACTWEARLAKLNSLLGQPAGLASLYAH